MRDRVSKELIQSLIELQVKIESVLILGGTSNDIEVSLIRGLYPNCNFFYRGIDNPLNDKNFEFLDLNIPYHGSDTFDLVITSQVLEHIWNIDDFFKTISRMCKPQNGLVWIACPTSNMPHGSPEYYCAGYTPDFIYKNIAKFGFGLVKMGSFGSERAYLSRHLARYWPDDVELEHPIRKYKFQPGTFLGNVNKFRKDFIRRFLISFFDNRTSQEIPYAVESFVLAKAS